MKLVAVFLICVFLVNLAQIALVVRAFGINTFVDSETGTVFDGNKNMSAVRTSVVNRFGMNLTTHEGGSTDLALVLAIATVVVVKIHVWGTAYWTDFIFRNLVAAAISNRP